MPSSETLISTIGSGGSSGALLRSAKGDTNPSGAMLSLNFSAPLTGQARSERINQMMNSHVSPLNSVQQRLNIISPFLVASARQADSLNNQPAFEKSRSTQALLCRIQTTLRRMPGIASNESGEIVSQLQEVGQVVSQETSQLVDALANLTLDQEEAEKSLARMSIDANLVKARANDQAQTIVNLKDELASANNKREQAEAEVSKIMQDLRDMSIDFKAMKDKVATEGKADSQKRSPPDSEEVIKTLESTIKHLEEQVNNRRSLWVMKHSDAQSVARAVETLAGSFQDNEAIHKTLMSLRSGSLGRSEPEGGENPEPGPSFAQAPPRAPSAFQPMSSVARPPTTGPPPKFGPLQGGPPRAPSAMQGRNYQGEWAPPPSSRSVSTSSALVQSPPFNSGPPRKGFLPKNRYRPSAPEFQPSGYGYPENHTSRPTSSFGFRREAYPVTPTAAPRNRYGRFHDFPSSATPEYGGPGFADQSPTVGPLIQMSEQTVAAWHERIDAFYSTIRGFVEQHAGMPMDGVLPKLRASPLWGVVIGTYYPLSEAEAASYLGFHVKEPNSKACLVTRLIIDYAVNKVWTPSAWAGVDGETSYALAELHKEFQRTRGQPSVVRQPLLDRQAAILDSVMRRDVGGVFARAKAEEITSELLRRLQPLMNRHASPTDAYRDLEAVAEAAWELSSGILTSRLTFDFRFPEIGCRFSAQSMLPVWPQHDPLDLQSKHWRVAMVTTPVITCRNDTGTNISAHSVSLADVFCMQ